MNKFRSLYLIMEALKARNCSLPNELIGRFKPPIQRKGKTGIAKMRRIARKRRGK